MYKASFVLLTCVLAAAQVHAQAVELIPFRDTTPVAASSAYNNNSRPPSAACDIDNLNSATQWMSSGFRWVDRDDHDKGTTGDNSPWIAFYFDDLYVLDHMNVRNFTESDGGRGIKLVNIWVSVTGNDDDWTPAFAEPVVFTSGVYQDWSNDGKWTPYDPQTVNFNGVEAMAVKFEILSNIYSNNFKTPEDDVNATIAGVGGVQFFGTPVPEPATMTLLALGGLAMLRRKWPA